MTWKWDQSAGKMYHNGVFVSDGYSGHGAGVNNPAAQGQQKVGPVPRGMWKMIDMRDSPNTGPKSIILHAVDATPSDDRHDATGRGAFRIHGDNAKGNRSASEGCIILPRPVRQRIWDSGDHDLEVVE